MALFFYCKVSGLLLVHLSLSRLRLVRAVLSVTLLWSHHSL